MAILQRRIAAGSYSPKGGKITSGYVALPILTTSSTSLCGNRDGAEECFSFQIQTAERTTDKAKFKQRVWREKQFDKVRIALYPLGSLMMGPKVLSPHCLISQQASEFRDINLKVSERPRPDLVLTIWIANHASFVSSCFRAGSVIKNESHFGNHRKTSFLEIQVRCYFW